MVRMCIISVGAAAVFGGIALFDTPLRSLLALAAVTAGLIVVYAVIHRLLERLAPAEPEDQRTTFDPRGKDHLRRLSNTGHRSTRSSRRDAA